MKFEINCNLLKHLSYSTRDLFAWLLCFTGLANRCMRTVLLLYCIFFSLQKSFCKLKKIYIQSLVTPIANINLKSSIINA